MMSSTIVLLLLLLALVLPVVGAAALRLLIPRLSAGQFYAGAAAVFAVAVASVVLLARSNIDNVQVGNLTLVLPVSGMDNGELAFANPNLGGDTAAASNAPGLTMPVTDSTELPTAIMPAAAPTVAAQATEATPTEAPTAASTATPEPTEAPTPTEEPTAVPPTEAPPTETPAPPTEAPQQQTYTVKKGDTLRSIAEKFDVSVEALLRANNLTPSQADALRIDQKLVIP